jgi:hypothetical protein
MNNKNILNNKRKKGGKTFPKNSNIFPCLLMDKKEYLLSLSRIKHKTL